MKPSQGRLWMDGLYAELGRKIRHLNTGTGVRHQPSRSTSHGAKSSMLRGTSGKGIFLASSAELGSPPEV